ncbi:DUF7002 family protein [Bacillus sp. 3255]|uniref:DUF7002 family protein n=1 Tax=Bacillus sp. 3255 TaxID=2817904 RepID=UPI00285717A6|nr:hypothetical protein [Bacillus sp. 3255]MDR6879816.1 hypothetical protein [Bacillus sp. 3255]
MDNEAVLAIADMITRAGSRKSLFHFTRASNLLAIAAENTLGSSHWLDPGQAGERRVQPESIRHQGYRITINAHLRIAESMMEAGTTLEQFRAHLDRHVFFWPTRKDCQMMIDTYSRREPEEAFAVLELDARSMFIANHSSVKLSKYDSGSSPRFPHRCSYRKSLAMFLPFQQFGTVTNPLVPAKPSEIKEVLMENKVTGISSFLKALYVNHSDTLPENWRRLARPWVEWVEK